MERAAFSVLVMSEWPGLPQVPAISVVLPTLALVPHVEVHHGFVDLTVDASVGGALPLTIAGTPIRMAHAAVTVFSRVSEKSVPWRRALRLQLRESGLRQQVAHSPTWCRALLWHAKVTPRPVLGQSQGKTHSES